MKRDSSWSGVIAINIHWLGINTVTGSLTPVLLPFLVALFVPAERKNTYLGTVRVISLAVAMAAQPIAGLLSDRSTFRWGRRRPFILIGSVLSVFCLLVVGFSPFFMNSHLDRFFEPIGVPAAYIVLLTGIVLWQGASNIGQGALQGLIPDLVPENRRGQASGIKAVMELLAAVPIMFIGPLVDAGRIWLTISLVAGLLLMTTLVTILGVHEEPLRQRPSGRIRKSVLRLVALSLIFVTVTLTAVWLVRTSGALLIQRGAPLGLQVAVIGLTGLVGMAGSILLGVYLGARIGIGTAAAQETSFIWWVINRLLFFAAAGSVQGFTLYFLRDVHHVPNVATITTVLLIAVAGFLIFSALGGGYLADRLGHRRLVAWSSLIAAVGTFLLLLAPNLSLVLVSGCIIGIGTGAFMSTNWALGTDLVPAQEAGRYLGIANLAGAGAGIVGAGIGGPMADLFNALQPGLGYAVIFAIYGLLFVLSAITLTQVKKTVVCRS
ncbi:MAG: MFS transporter [Anaerolineae bacterium]|jgi:MFS family permease